MKKIIDFLSVLKQNNNKNWFDANRAEYVEAKGIFELFCTELLERFSNFDKDMLKVSTKEAIFRIFRDVRFSPDKRPYKFHMGAYMAAPFGRKSNRGGYYLHIEPNASFLGVGVWKPDKEHLNAVRKSIYFNYSEFSEIIINQNFQKYFENSFYEKDKLKKLPAEFDKDFPEPELLKYKHYLVSCNFYDDEVLKDDFKEKLSIVAKVAYPFLLFINEAIDEMEEEIKL